tara:strand:+ start:65 stop:940 length:876 start_codon:yes stop_codon:yes gene_type:complete
LIFFLYNSQIDIDLPINKYFNCSPSPDATKTEIKILQKKIEFKILNLAITKQYSINLTSTYGEIYKKNIGRFILREGRIIEYEASKKVKMPNLITYIFTHVIGFLFYQRDHLVMHASAIKLNGKSILFCGRSGFGKSYLVKKFLPKAYFIAEDICCISKEYKIALPSLPFIKVENVPDTNNKKRFYPTENDKRNRIIVPIEQANEFNNTEIKVCFFLKFSEKSSIEPINNIEAFKNILSNSFFSDPILKEDQIHNARKISSFLEGVQSYNLTRAQNENFDLKKVESCLAEI